MKTLQKSKPKLNTFKDQKDSKSPQRYPTIKIAEGNKTTVVSNKCNLDDLTRKFGINNKFFKEESIRYKNGSQFTHSVQNYESKNENSILIQANMQKIVVNSLQNISKTKSNSRYQSNKSKKQQEKTLLKQISIILQQNLKKSPTKDIPQKRCISQCSISIAYPNRMIGYQKNKNSHVKQFFRMGTIRNFFVNSIHKQKEIEKQASKFYEIQQQIVIKDQVQESNCCELPEIIQKVSLYQSAKQQNENYLRSSFKPVGTSLPKKAQVPKNTCYFNITKNMKTPVKNKKDKQFSQSNNRTFTQPATQIQKKIIPELQLNQFQEPLQGWQSQNIDSNKKHKRIPDAAQNNGNSFNFCT